MKFGTTSAIVLIGALGMGTGCVMKEQYEAEKNRALNFQRLLAQEEKRTGDLDAEAKRLRRDLPELEAKNRELTAQLQAVREQAARMKEENDALREAAAIKAKEDTHRSPEPKMKSRSKAVPKSEPSRVEPLALEDMPVSSPSLSDAGKGLPIYHVVRPGDTLFRVARQYGVQVDQLKEWNHLSDTVIEVGQKLVVGYQ